MSKRLQVLMDQRDYQAIQKEARRQRLSVGEWVRRSIHSTLKSSPQRNSQEKLEALRKAMALGGNTPSGDIEDILNQIHSGYLSKGRL